MGRWREGRRTRPGFDRNRVSAKKWLGSTLLSALLLLTAGGLIWIVWLMVNPWQVTPEFVAFHHQVQGTADPQDSSGRGRP